jgi:hypothetical protein
MAQRQEWDSDTGTSDQRRTITVRCTGQPEQISIPLHDSQELVHHHILQVCPSCPLGIDLTSDIDFVIAFSPPLIP